MTNLKLLVFFCAVGLLVNKGLTATTFNIKVETIATDRTTTTQDIEQAFYKLMRRLTSQPLPKTIANKNIMPLVEQYQYNKDGEHEFLSISFNKQAVRKFLVETKLVTDNSDHQVILFFALQKKATNYQLLSYDEGGDILDEISQQAQQFNFKLVLPTMDLQDLQLLDLDNISAEDPKNIQLMAKRYQAKGVLIVQLEKNAKEGWQSEWSLYTAGNHFSIAGDGFSLKLLAEQALAQFKQQIIEPAATQSVYVQVNQSSSNNDYQSMINVLKKLPGVRNVQLDGVTPDSVLFKLVINIGKEMLLSELKAHNQVELIASANKTNLIEIRIGS